ncbi:MAG: hypothetical protein IKW97_08530 [Muribaculaceae bacterium]|nr:hypothetical protein [Muribaculaceae bacterium]
MRLKSIVLGLLACVALAVAAQPTQQAPEWEWYMDEVISDTFVGRNYFEYYYTPSAADMEQQRSKGEVTYFLNSPEGLNSKKVKDMIDRLMASYDDIKAVGDWHVTTGTYWKEFRYEKNKFRFSVKRKALDDGTYYVSVTETAGFYKSLGKGKKSEAQPEKKARTAVSKSEKRNTRRDRHQVDMPVNNNDDGKESLAALLDGGGEDEEAAPVMTEKQRRQQAREQKEAEEMAERARARRAREKQREEADAQKQAEKQRKAELKQQKEEEKQLKKEEEKQRREKARREREQERREQAAARKQAATPKPVESKYHCNDVALWLSEKYDFTQTSGNDMSCTMFSTVVKDAEMAKLAIKNALKGSNARMAVPWRVNSETGMVETGYTVDGHVLVFAIGKNEDGNITLNVTEVSADEFETFKYVQKQ